MNYKSKKVQEVLKITSNKVDRFAAQMKIELENNITKGDVSDWSDDLSEKVFQLEYHKAKLLLAIREKNAFAIKEYLADCAIILMSIGDEFKLYDEDPVNTNMGTMLNEPLINIIPVEEIVIKSLIHEKIIH